MDCILNGLNGDYPFRMFLWKGLLGYCSDNCSEPPVQLSEAGLQYKSGCAVGVRHITSTSQDVQQK